MAIVGALSLRASGLHARVAASTARVGPLQLAVALGTALSAVAGTIGADSRWLAALGRIIVDRGKIPDGVPYASASSAGWHNVPVLAELILHGLTSFAGDRGLLVAQIVAVAAGLAILAWDLRRSGTDDLSGALVLLIVVVGALPALVVIRSQLFSILFFPALVALLRAEARVPSARLWLLLPLLALWSNLHGAVLVGLAVAGAYLVLERARRQPLVAGAVFGGSVIAVCAPPALEHTPDYYLGVLHNEAARRGGQLWAPVSLTSGVDWLLIAAAVSLVVMAFRARPKLWEMVVLAALAVLTIRTARSGVWLLFFTAAPAADLAIPLGPLLPPRGAGTRAERHPCGARAGRGPLSTGAADRCWTKRCAEPMERRFWRTGSSEQVALAGGRVWMTNPLDAFSRRDQSLYLDWLAGRPDGDAALQRAPSSCSSSGRRRRRRLEHTSRVRRVASDARAVLYVKLR
jgi:hypothetical protein